MSIDLDILPMAPVVNGPHCFEAMCANRHAGIKDYPPKTGAGYSGVMIVGDSGWEYESREGRLSHSQAQRGSFLISTYSVD